MELSFNIVIERQLVQAIIVSLTLVIVIMILLYSLVIMMTAEEKRLHFYGMSARGAVGTASSLIFSVLMAHINLREQFSGEVAYLEMFYYIAYLYILVSSVLIYIFMKNFENKNHWLVITFLWLR
ncbi:MAG TPA: hypothetical protein PLU43_08840 [Lachnospiraceae bacterium]|nr:hypothetical protein [Lachnospiraceae bacterium]